VVIVETVPDVELAGTKQLAQRPGAKVAPHAGIEEIGDYAVLVDGLYVGHVVVRQHLLLRLWLPGGFCRTFAIPECIFVAGSRELVMLALELAPRPAGQERLALAFPADRSRPPAHGSSPNPRSSCALLSLRLRFCSGT